MSDVIRQESRSDNQLEQDGFKQYPRKKELVMARKLPASEAPLEIKTAWGETLIAQAGYIICYDTGTQFSAKPEAYEHWPVEPLIFQKTYKVWDEAFAPTKAQEQLAKSGASLTTKLRVYGQNRWIRVFISRALNTKNRY